MKKNILFKDAKINEEMSKHCTFKIGGKAKYFVTPNTINDLKKIIKTCNSYSVKYVILGNGSNVIFKDSGYDGVVISLKKLNNIQNASNNIVMCEAGATLYSLNKYLCENNFSGLEWSYGIPASVGGAIYMNCGSYDKSISDNIIKIMVLEKGKLKIYKRNEILFDYRYSSFQTRSNIILKVWFSFKCGIKSNIRASQKQYLQKKLESQPLSSNSAGSVFKRQKNIIPAKIIDKLGLKGVRIGDIQVSTKHSGFFVNLDAGTHTDYKKLVDYVKAVVKEKENVELETEIIEIGD